MSKISKNALKRYYQNQEGKREMVLDSFYPTNRQFVSMVFFGVENGEIVKDIDENPRRTTYEFAGKKMQKILKQYDVEYQEINLPKLKMQLIDFDPNELVQKFEERGIIAIIQKGRNDKNRIKEIYTKEEYKKKFPMQYMQEEAKEQIKSKSNEQAQNQGLEEVKEALQEQKQADIPSPEVIPTANNSL